MMFTVSHVMGTLGFIYITLLLVRDCQCSVVVGRLHRDVLLPCIVTYSGEFDYNALVINWQRTEDDTVVHSFHYNASQSQYEDKRYRGRTQIFYDQLPEGNASLLLRNLSYADTGNYTCNTIITEKTGYVTKYAELLVEDISEEAEVTGLHKGLIALAAVVLVLLVTFSLILLLRKCRGKEKKNEKKSDEEKPLFEDDSLSGKLDTYKQNICKEMSLSIDHLVVRNLRIEDKRTFCVNDNKHDGYFSEQKNLINSEELFTPSNKNLRADRMLLLGNAGVGKTSLCNWLLWKWANDGELLYKCVLHLSLKKCDKEQISVKDLLDENCKVASEILHNHPRNLLLILDDIDGLYCDKDQMSVSDDEIITAPDKITTPPDDINTTFEFKSLVTNIITKRLLHDTDVLIVSCVGSMCKLQKHCSLLFFIQDFSDEEAQHFCKAIMTNTEEAKYMKRIKESKLWYLTKMPLYSKIALNILNSHYSTNVTLNDFETASDMLIYKLHHNIKDKRLKEAEFKQTSYRSYENFIARKKIRLDKDENILWNNFLFPNDKCSKCIDYQYELLRDMLAAVYCSWEIHSGENVKECLNTWICGYSANGNTINKLLQPLVDEHHARFNNFTKFLMRLLHYPDYDSLFNYCPLMKDNIRESLVDWFRSKKDLDNQDQLKLFQCLFELHDEQVTSKLSDRFKIIKLYSIPLSALDIQVLKYCLEKSSLEEIDLRRCGLRDEDVAQLQNIIKNTKNVWISSNHLTEQSGDLLNKLLEDSDCSIEKLALSTNKLGSSGLRAIFRALEQNKTLKSLFMNNNNIDKEIVVLINSLDKNNTLNELELCGNPFSTDGLESIKQLKNQKKDLKIVLCILEDEAIFSFVVKNVQRLQNTWGNYEEDWLMKILHIVQNDLKNKDCERPNKITQERVDNLSKLVGDVMKKGPQPFKQLQNLETDKPELFADT